MPLENGLDELPDVAPFPRAIQLLEPFIDRFADDIGEREALLPQ